MDKVPFEVVCINAGFIKRKDGTIGNAPGLKEGATYTVIHQRIGYYGTLGYKLKEVDGNYNTHFYASRFRKINPYQSSVSRSLAERAVESIGDGQDMKPVKKEVVNS